MRAGLVQTTSLDAVAGARSKRYPGPLSRFGSPVIFKRIDWPFDIEVVGRPAAPNWDGVGFAFMASSSTTGHYSNRPTLASPRSFSRNRGKHGHGKKSSRGCRL